MMAFIQSDANNLTKILGHLQTSAIMDLLLTLVRMEELPEGKGVVKVSFLYCQVCVYMLIINDCTQCSG